MGDIKTYKCPNCDGAITFDATAQKMKCPYCKTEIDVASLVEYEDDKVHDDEDHFGWEEVNFDNVLSEEEGDLKRYICQSCGGEVVGDAYLASSSCPFCGNPVIMEEQFEGILRPDYVIPFKYNKEQAKEAMLKHFKGKFLLPNDFKSAGKLDKINGVYVPYWLFDADAKGGVRYRATRTNTFVSGDYNVTETLHFLLYREGIMHFEKIPNDASMKFDDKTLEALEPYDFNEIMDFKTAYLQGYLSDRYGVKPDDVKNRVNERMRNSMIEELSMTTVGYSSVIPESVRLSFNDGKVHYALLPVYVLHMKYHGKDYQFMMNGQTGKFVGDLPKDNGKLIIMMLSVFVITFILCFLLMYVI